MSQPAKSKKARASRKKTEVVSEMEPVPPTPKGAKRSKANPEAAPSSPKSSKKAAPPAPARTPQPVYASGPTQSDFIGLGVLLVVIAAAVALYLLWGRADMQTLSPLPLSVFG